MERAADFVHQNKKTNPLVDSCGSHEKLKRQTVVHESGASHVQDMRCTLVKGSLHHLRHLPATNKCRSGRRSDPFLNPYIFFSS